MLGPASQPCPATGWDLVPAPVGSFLSLHWIFLSALIKIMKN